MNAKIINISYNFWKNLFKMLKLNSTRLISLLIKKNNLKNIKKQLLKLYLSLINAPINCF